MSAIEAKCDAPSVVLAKPMIRSSRLVGLPRRLGRVGNFRSSYRRLVPHHGRSGPMRGVLNAQSKRGPRTIAG